MFFSFTKKNKESFLVIVYAVWAIWNFCFRFLTMSGGIFDSFVPNIDFLLNLFCLFAPLLYTLSHPIAISHNKTDKNIAVVFLIVYAFYASYMLFEGITIFGLLFLPIMPIQVYIFLKLHADIKIRIFELFIRILGILLLLSLVEYIVYVTTDRVVIIQDGILSYDYDYQMSFFNLIRVSPELSSLGISNIYRFQSLAEEPGGVGTMCGILIYVLNNSKKYRLENIVFWIAGLVSMSRAFYVLAGIRLAFSLFYQNKKRGLIFIIVLGLIFVLLYSQFQDAFNLLLLGRFEEHGLERTETGSLMQSIANGTIWFGNGTKATLDLHSAGVGTMVFQVGILRVIALVLFYFFAFLRLLKTAKPSHTFPAILFCIAFFASFYQRQYILNYNFVLVYFTMPYLTKYNETISIPNR